MQELEKILEILDKLQFFGGQRAGRELWNDKQREVQDEDIKSFNQAIESVRDFIRKCINGKDNNVPTNDGWIPVEDALPEGKALACDKYGEIMIGYIGGNANGGYDCEGDGYEMFNVLAWRPLPEPYRPEKEGEKNGRP